MKFKDIIINEEKNEEIRDHKFVRGDEVIASSLVYPEPMKGIVRTLTGKNMVQIISFEGKRRYYDATANKIKLIKKKDDNSTELIQKLENIKQKKGYIPGHGWYTKK